MIVDETTDEALRALAAKGNAKLAEGCLVVGKIYRHPKTRRLLRVTSGSFLGAFDRVSNFWYWDYLDENHELTGKSAHGYGWPANRSEEYMEKLELTIDPGYANWGLWEAVRELVQNYLDALDKTGEGSIAYNPMAQRLVMTNGGITMDRRALILGNTKKCDDESSRGQWGEGMKIAWATLSQLGCDIRVMTGTEVWTPEIVESAAFDGARLLSVTVRPNVIQPDSVSVQIDGILNQDWKMIQSRVLPLARPIDLARISGNGGRLLLNEIFVGKLFVKGLYVCDLPGKWKWGYDLDNVELDRDRKIPSGMSLGPIVCDLLKDLTINGHLDADIILGMLEDEDSKEAALFTDWWNDRASGPFHEQVTAKFKVKYGESAVPVANDEEAIKADNHDMQAVIVPKALRVVVAKSEGELCDRIAAQPPRTIRRTSATAMSDSEIAILTAAFNLISDAIEWLTESDVLIVDFSDPGKSGDFRDGKISLARRLLKTPGMLIVVLAHEAACRDAREGTAAHRDIKDRIIAHAIDAEMGYDQIDE